MSTVLQADDISSLRALIAQRTVQDQIERSFEKFRRLPVGNIPIEIGPIPPEELKRYDPTIGGPAPGFEGIEDTCEEAQAVDTDVHGCSQPVVFDVGIVGAGMAGLYTAMILEDLGLKYNIIEASSRPGGRVWSYHFTGNEGDYYDVGAMRFPNIPIMRRTFDLFKKLLMETNVEPSPAQGELIPYYFTGPKNPLYYNNILHNLDLAQDNADIFQVSVSNGGTVLDKYVKKGYANILKDIFDGWKNSFADPETFDETWRNLMTLDERCTSLRSLITTRYELQGDAPKNIYYLTNWCETMDAASTHYDEAFTANLLHSLEFEYPAMPQTINDPKPIIDSNSGEDGGWWCVNGGADIIAKRMINHLNKQPRYDHQVVAIEKVKYGDKTMFVTMLDNKTSTEITEKYSHVITTTTNACLQTMDLRNAGLNYAQREAIRVLRYDNSVKVGIKFSTRWWATEKGITRGGLGKTDRPTRVVVYPSYALDTLDTDPGVLLASYNWSQDASRLGGLMQSEKGPNDQEVILQVVLEDLALMHEMNVEDLRCNVESYHVHDWNRDIFTNGAFGFFGPGQYSSFFGQLQRPAGNGKLFMAGEITSIYHGWIVASLNSAFRAVHQMLLVEYFAAGKDQTKKGYISDLLDKLEKNWGGSPFEPKSEYDFSRSGNAICTWQVLLGIIGYDI